MSHPLGSIIRLPIANACWSQAIHGAVRGASPEKPVGMRVVAGLQTNCAFTSPACVFVEDASSTANQPDILPQSHFCGLFHGEDSILRTTCLWPEKWWVLQECNLLREDLARAEARAAEARSAAAPLSAENSHLRRLNDALSGLPSNHANSKTGRFIAIPSPRADTGHSELRLQLLILACRTCSPWIRFG